MGYIFVVFDYENTTSCGQVGNFQNFDVHNLLICYLSDGNFSVPSGNKKGRILPSSPLIKTYKTGFSLLRIALPHLWAYCLLWILPL